MLSQTKREAEKIRELSREYSAKGYRVVIEPSPNELPNFMKSLNFHPDLIVYGEEENFVIEVKSRHTIADASNFTYIADIIRKQENWDLILVITNPKSEVIAKEKRVLHEEEHASRQFEEAQALLQASKQGEFISAALLIAWAGLETALRYSLSSLYQMEEPITPQTLVRNATMYGVLSRNDINSIELIMKIRNSVAHGHKSLKGTEKDVKQIIEVGRKVLKETQNQISHNNPVEADVE